MAIAQPFLNRFGWFLVWWPSVECVTRWHNKNSKIKVQSLIWHGRNNLQNNNDRKFVSLCRYCKDFLCKDILRVPTIFPTLFSGHNYPKKWPIFKKSASFDKFRFLAFQREVKRYCSLKIVDFTAFWKKSGKCEKRRIFDVFFRFS